MRYTPAETKRLLEIGDPVRALGLNRKRWARDIETMIKRRNAPRIELRLRSRASWVALMIRAHRHPLGEYERTGRGVVRNANKAIRRSRRSA